MIRLKIPPIDTLCVLLFKNRQEEPQGLPHRENGLPKDVEGVPEVDWGLPKELEGLPRRVERLPGRIERLPGRVAGVLRPGRGVRNLVAGVLFRLPGVRIADVAGLEEFECGGAFFLSEEWCR
jgi:hypothetical protein